MRNRNFSIVLMIMCIILLVSCRHNNSPGQIDNSNEQSSAENGRSNVNVIQLEELNYDSYDTATQWENDNPSYIEFNGDSINFKGNGAVVTDNSITITAAGTYVVSGKLNDGSIVIDLKSKGVVRLVLNGVDMYCSNSSPIYCKNAEKLVIILADGTQNKVSDGDSYVFSDQAEQEPNATIFSKSDMTVTGQGELIIDANFNNGIMSKDVLKITGGSITVNAADDGIIGRDVVAVKDGNITVEAGGDGIKTTNDTDSQKGYIVIENGIFDITAGSDALQAESVITVNNGEFKIVTGGGSVNSSYANNNGRENMWGRWNNKLNTSQQDNQDDSQSAKGLKAAVQIVINGGSFTIDSSDDAIHSNDSIIINDGDISIASGDDGIHADANIKIAGGNIQISKCYEGIESANIYLSGGDMHITAYDDGINVAGGVDGSAINGRPGQNAFKASGNDRLVVDSGYIFINASGDGMDVNGSIYMNGGTVVINGPTSNGNGALDYDGVFEITGGLLVAAGSAGMAQAPSNGSSQPSIMMTFSTVQPAGKMFCIEDDSQKAVLGFIPEKEYQTIVFSSPELKQGTNYTVYTGGKFTGNAKDGLITDGQYSSTTKVVSFKISKVVTYLSESGEIEGGFNPGGRPMPGQGGVRQVPRQGRRQMPGQGTEQLPDRQMPSNGV